MTVSHKARYTCEELQGDALGKPHNVFVSSSGQQGLVESLQHTGHRSHEVTAAVTLPEGRARNSTVVLHVRNLGEYEV